MAPKSGGSGLMAAAGAAAAGLAAAGVGALLLGRRNGRDNGKVADTSADVPVLEPSDEVKTPV
ncbi:MAG: hypothetical protein ACRC1H_18725 [Caldilineaceae bacterium]